MKLKRCPNLHYYDGDKYDRCPHCNQTDEKVKVQEPKPTPAPKPEPEPQPAPTPVPKPSAPVAQEPDESNAWRCQCGAVSHGLFCPQCGSRKPGPQPVKEDPKPAPVSQPVPQPSPEPEAVEEPVAVPEPIAEPSPEPLSEPEAFPLTESAPLVNHIRDDGFTGDSFEEPLKEEQEDDGKTQVIFEEIEDDLPLGWLTVLNTAAKGRVFTLNSARTTLGRADAANRADIDLRSDRSISRGAQATVVYDPLNKKYFLQRAGGKTFVYINREMVLTYAALKPYDIIRIGETELVFVPLCSEHFSW